ncbi:MAG: condensation domain-containing protein [Nostoc sp. SerVER01]
MRGSNPYPIGDSSCNKASKKKIENEQQLHIGMEITADKRIYNTKLFTPMNNINRPLGAMEKIFLLLDQISQVHFVIAAEIIGTKTIIEWRKALDALQARHPFLSVCIKNNGFDYPFFQHEDKTKIPLRVVEENGNYRWEKELEKELSMPFDSTQTPLVRAVLVQQGQKSIFIFSSHHAIGDGMSDLIIINDLLKSLSGQQLLPLAAPDSSDNLLGITNDYYERVDGVSSISDTLDQPVFIRRDEAMPFVERSQLSSEFTLRLSNRCKAEGTTIHGALCTAFVMAGKEIEKDWKNKPIRLVSPASSRKALNTNDSMAQYIVSKTIIYPEQTELAFWDMARFSKRELEGISSLESIKTSIEIASQLVFNAKDVMEISNLLQKGVAREIMLTNLGRLPYQTDFGTLKLEGIWGPLALSGYKGDQTIGVTTTNGSMRLVHVSRIPLKPLLRVAENILIAACK